jgi:hypothetical protein
LNFTRNKANILVLGKSCRFNRVRDGSWLPK